MKRKFAISLALCLTTSFLAAAEPDGWEWHHHPFFRAVATNAPEAMENMLRLLEEGADPNERVQGFAPLMVAAKASNVPAMEL